MEPIAENRITITKSLFYEGMLRVSAEHYGKLAKKAILFLGAVWLLLTAVTVWLQQSLVYVAAELVILCLIALWIGVYMPRNKAKKAFRAMEGKYGADLDRVTRFYEDRLEVEAAGQRTAVFYSEIARILPSKRLLVLVTADKTGILLALDGFTPGGEAILRERIKNAKEKENTND